MNVGSALVTDAKSAKLGGANPAFVPQPITIGQAFPATPRRSALSSLQSLVYAARLNVLAKHRLYRHAALLDVFELDLTVV